MKLADLPTRQEAQKVAGLHLFLVEGSPSLLQERQVQYAGRR